MKLNFLFNRYKLYIKKQPRVLAGVAQWIEWQLVNPKVASLIPSQGTCLGCRPGPQFGGCERPPHTDVSLLLFLPPSASL